MGEEGLAYHAHDWVIDKKTYDESPFLNDFFHLNVNEGLFRKFFLFESAKARAGHSMTRIGHEVYLYGGQGQNNTVFDDMWRFDLENVQWAEQKQADLVGLVAEKQQVAVLN